MNKTIFVPIAELNDILFCFYKVFLNCLINQDQFNGANFLVKLAFNSTGRQFPFDNRTSHLTSPSQRHVFSSFWFDWLISNKCNADFLKNAKADVYVNVECTQHVGMHIKHHNIFHHYRLSAFRKLGIEILLGSIQNKIRGSVTLKDTFLPFSTLSAVIFFKHQIKERKATLLITRRIFPTHNYFGWNPSP